jgi:hypothetical protein
MILKVVLILRRLEYEDSEKDTSGLMAIGPTRNDNSSISNGMHRISPFYGPLDRHMMIVFHVF